MKRIVVVVLLCALQYTLQAQTQLLKIDGELPHPFADKTGLNTIYTQGNPVPTGGVIQLSAGSDYLAIDTFNAQLNINEDWVIGTDILLTDSTDEIAIIDFRSTSSTGNMYFYYGQEDPGLHFGDRSLNGDSGYLVADHLPLPQNTWVNIKLQKSGNHLIIYRDGVVTADTLFFDTLSPIARTTIGYSEDRRAPHDTLLFDSFKIWEGSVTGIKNMSPVTMDIFPNPAGESFTIRVNENMIGARVTITDVAGRKMAAVSLTTRHSLLATHHLPNGVYFVTIESGKQNVTQKLIITK